ncbi:MAG: LacI family DNA-binding transcriptional regulator [Acetatifactor sp.]
MSTIKEIAERAGVSTATVSNVIHGNTKKVSPSTIELIEKLIQEMGYVPKMGLSVLNNGSSKMIAVVIHTHKQYEDAVISDPFYGAIIGFIEEKLRVLGYYMLLYSTDDVNEVFRTVMAWNIDGIIALSFSRNDCNKIWFLTHKPLISIDSYGISHDDTNVTNIGLDDSTGGALMVKYILECGYKNILVCATNDYGVDQARWLGAKDAFEKNTGKNEDKVIRLINIGNSITKRESVYQQLIRQVPFSKRTAAFFLSDYYAIEAISYLSGKGIRIPTDLGIAGFDDITYAHLTVPKLTTIQQSMERKAELAVSELMQAIHEPVYLGKEVILDVSLIARDSI